MDRTFNTLFMLMSLDGKISTGDGDERDVDKDYRTIQGIKEGLHQYYDLEKNTDRFSFNTGKVMAKIGVNTDKSPIKSPDMNFIIIDNNHLTEKGVINLFSNLNKLFLVTKNQNHPSLNLNHPKLEVIKYYETIDFDNLFRRLKSEYLIDRITIQSGGTMNATLLRDGLIDNISLVVAPALVGGKDTPTLIDGKSFINLNDLQQLKALKLLKCTVLDNSYIHLTYEVINKY